MQPRKQQKKPPVLRRHKNTGHAYVLVNRKQHWLGHHDDPATHAKYQALMAEWWSNGGRFPDAEPEGEPYRVRDLIADWVSHLERQHDAEWLATNQRIRYALKPVLAMFGPTPAADFGPRRLTTVRDAMIRSGKLCRREINSRIHTIRRAVRWGVATEKLPPSVAHALDAVAGLRRGDYDARESRVVRPVAENDVWAVLPYVSRQVAALVELMWHTGSRPSELFGLRPCDIDRSGKVWSVTLTEHKCSRHGQDRVILFGAKGQAVLRRFLDRVPPPPPDRPLFRPVDAEKERNHVRRQDRKTPLWESHQRRNDDKRQGRVLAETYTATTLRHAVERGITAATQDRETNGRPAVARWTPYALRHSAGTRIRREYGLEVAQAVLGHASATTTEIYAEVDLEKARRAMESAG